MQPPSDHPRGTPAPGCVGAAFAAPVHRRGRPSASSGQALCHIAAPWRRLAAAVIDTIILLLWNAVAFILAVGVAPDRAWAFNLPAFAMLSALAYLGIGWAVWGMTIGKWMLGIRVVAAAGGKLSPWRALARVPAFLVASAPLKIGLAAILWDERRRGWHDHLAGTMVIRTTASATREDGMVAHSDVAQPPHLTTGGQASAVNGRLWARGAVIVMAMLAAYAVVAVAVTMPLACNFSTHIPGADIEGLNQDGYVFLWDFWWVRTALTTPGLHLMSTQYLFWPQVVSLRYHTLLLLHSGAAGLLQSALSLIQTYNLLLLLSLAACAWGAFLLCRYLTANTAAAAVAGLAFGFCPYLTTHALAHHNLIAAEWLAPLAYCALRGLREARARYVIGAAASWALVGLCEWYYFLYAGLLLIILALCDIAARPRAWAKTLAAASAMMVITGVALSPLLGPMLSEWRQAPYMRQPLARPAALGAQPGLYLTPAFTNPLMGDTGAAVLRAYNYSRAEATLYVGIVVIALAAMGAIYHRRQLAPWIAGAVFFLLLALGPYLRLGDRTLFNALALLMLGGPPGNAFDLPVSAGLSSRLAMALVGGGDLLAAQVKVPLPYLWLWEYARITGLAAVPTRAVLPAMLCLVVLAAAGLTVITQGLTRKWQWLIAGLAAVLVLFEFAPVPYPLRELRVPRFYRSLARGGSDFAVAEVPLRGDYAVYMYYQTVHHKPILAGLVSRQPHDALDFVRRNALLRQLQPLPQRLPGAPVLRLTYEVAQVGNLRHRCSLSELRAQYGPALAQMQRNRVRLIVVHPDLLTPTDNRAVERVLHQALGLAPRPMADGIIVYPLRADHLAQRVYPELVEGPPGCVRRREQGHGEGLAGGKPWTKRSPSTISGKRLASSA